MTWNEVVSKVKEKLRRGFGGGSRDEIEVAAPGTSLEPLDDARLATPVVDVYENDKELLIFADVPGGTREGASVAWDEARGLTFAVKTRALPAGTLWASEYKPCDWYRTIELPAYVDGSKATCTMKDGVLTIRIPKRATASKLIPVKAG
jgi:HSP20 family molecular chaperone IbpA